MGRRKLLIVHGVRRSMLLIAVQRSYTKDFRGGFNVFNGALTLAGVRL